MKKLQDEHRIAFSSANSINWGRHAPDRGEHVGLRAVGGRRQKLNSGDELDVACPRVKSATSWPPTTPAHGRRAVGHAVPVRQQRELRAHRRLHNTGTYHDISGAPFVLTPSPSMDILVSSTWRQLPELTGRDAAAIVGWMARPARAAPLPRDEENFRPRAELFASDSSTTPRAWTPSARWH